MKKYGALIALLFMLASCGGSGPSSSSSGADPGVIDAPIAYVKRPIPADDNGDFVQTDIREPTAFSLGGDLYIRDHSTTTANETNITRSITQGAGDVKGVNVSYDGNKLIFSMRAFDENPNDDEDPSWDIYEYEVDAKTLRRIIPDDFTAELGEDLFPAYLPDGRIIFSSTRQRKSGEILNNESKDRFSALDEDEDEIAMVLHVMNDDGSELHQVSFNQSHDLYPTVLNMQSNGYVMFSRWDNANQNNALSLYMTKPDGTDLQVLYGVHSHDTGSSDNTIQFAQARETMDGDLVALTQPFTGTFGGGDIVIIDSSRFIDNQQPTWTLNGLLGPAQSKATVNDVANDGTISLVGRYSSVFPLWDGSDRMLVAKSTCQILVEEEIRPCIEPWISEADIEEVSPAYGIWIYDRGDDTEKVIVLAEQGIVMSDVVSLQSRIIPSIISDKTIGELDGIWQDEGIAALHIRSVYDIGNESFNGCFFTDCTTAANIFSVDDLGDPALAIADERPARFIRFSKAVALPDDNDPNLDDPPDLSNAAFGTSRTLGMREIVGYAPVAPDGSVKVKVPADVPLAISILDRQGRRIGPRHSNWIQLRPGDTVSCSGCHSHAQDSVFPHQRPDAQAPSINAGIPASGIFENTQIPGSTDVYWGDLGESMAETRFRLAPTQPQLNADIFYSDVWTDPNVRTIDAPFSYNYANLGAGSLSPASPDCSPWTFKCRIVINYEQHIHPLWNLPRGAADADTCTNCHTITDNGLDRVADAQLDLTDGISDMDNQRFKSFVELFFSDQGETLDVDDNLVNIQIEVPILDENGDQVIINGVPQTEFIDDPAALVLRSMNNNSARNTYFIEKMTETELEAGRTLTPVTDVDFIDHSGFMSPDELKMISEWIDIGAQYFNNPFDPDVPVN